MTFLKDYNDALDRAIAYDNSIAEDAGNISSDYASLVALSIRQTFGAIEITVPQQSLDTDDTLTFMKRSSSINLTTHRSLVLIHMLFFSSS